MNKTNKNKLQHGWSGTKTHNAWSHMLDRCNNPKAVSYGDYGGRGIQVCPRWDYFENFLEDMGPVPERLSLERLDNDKGYDPENCMWACQSQQVRNQRSVRKSLSGYRGVRKHGKKWGAFIYVNNKFISLGSYDTVDLALSARRAGEEKYWNIIPGLDKRIPSHLKAGGMNFKIVYPYHFVERTDIAGRIMFDEEVILVTNIAESGKKATKAHSWRVLFHEIAHIIDKVYCADGIGTEMDNETLIDGIGIGIAQILSDNFYMIPKERGRRYL